MGSIPTPDPLPGPGPHAVVGRRKGRPAGMPDEYNVVAYLMGEEQVAGNHIRVVTFLRGRGFGSLVLFPK